MLLFVFREALEQNLLLSVKPRLLHRSFGDQRRDGCLEESEVAKGFFERFVKDLVVTTRMERINKKKIERFAHIRLRSGRPVQFPPPTSLPL